MSWLAALALPFALWGIGRRALGRALSDPRSPTPPGARSALALLAGTLAFYLALALLAWAGIPWTRWTLLAALALLFAISSAISSVIPSLGRDAAVSHEGMPREGAPADPPELGWGDAMAIALVVAFALLAATRWVATPDFVYHWGLKAERFARAGGIDFPFLARPWNGGPGVHPDYPNLVPSLYAATALLAGGFDAGSLMLWSAVAFAAIVAALRGTLGAYGVERWTAQAAIAMTAAVMATFALGNLLAGGADWMIALALAAVAPALCGLAGEAADLQIGVAAAFAAASKIEGVPLAAFLVVAHLLARALRGGPEARRPAALARSLLRAGLPPAAAIVPWLAVTARHGLFQATNSGPFDWSRRQAIWQGFREVANSAPLHGLPWALALLPLLWLARRTRPLAAVVSAQALFYAWAYLASSIEPRLYVLSNGSRLLFQLLPAILIGAVLTTEPAAAAAPPA